MPAPRPLAFSVLTTSASGRAPQSRGPQHASEYSATRPYRRR
nr:MAG TPA: hypothetical protein [Caudoviricetes sp.]